MAHDPVPASEAISMQEGRLCQDDHRRRASSVVTRGAASALVAPRTGPQWRGPQSGWPHHRHAAGAVERQADAGVEGAGRHRPRLAARGRRPRLHVRAPRRQGNRVGPRSRKRQDVVVAARRRAVHDEPRGGRRTARGRSRRRSWRGTRLFTLGITGVLSALRRRHRQARCGVRRSKKSFRSPRRTSVPRCRRWSTATR